MAMLKDEIAILKSVMMKLDDTTAMVVVRQYHTEPNEYGKVDRSKSKYRWIARIFKIEDLAKAIQALREDSNRLNKFRWPDDPWPWYTSAGYPENWKIAEWLMTKLKKLKSWEDGQKALAGWENATRSRKVAGYNNNAKYEVDGYLDSTGKQVSLADKNALLGYIGQNLIKVDAKKPKHH